MLLITTCMACNVPFVYSNAGVVMEYYGSAKAEPRICRYCHGIATVWSGFYNPNQSDCLKHFKTATGVSRIVMVAKELPRTSHGLATNRQGFVKVSLRSFTDASGLRIRGDPASAPGQWDLDVK